jgi:hypothetical protein
VAKKKYEVTARLRAAGNWFVATLVRRGFGARSTYLLTRHSRNREVAPSRPNQAVTPGAPEGPPGQVGLT